jgi:hypothetical protein
LISAWLISVRTGAIRANDSRAIESSVEISNWRLATGGRQLIKRIYAEIEIAQGRIQALQEDGHGQGEARTFRPAPHAHVQSPQA